MREIKFRAWDKENKKMIGPFCVGSELSMAWPPEMQYTGLKDKTGVEYYQDDIFRDNRTGYVYRVIKENGAFWGAPIDGPHEHYTLTLLCHINVTSEIIGNIYENPELDIP